MNERDYDNIDQDDILILSNVRKAVEQGKEIIVENRTKQKKFPVKFDLTGHEKEMVLEGSLLNVAMRRHLVS